MRRLFFVLAIAATGLLAAWLGWRWLRTDRLAAEHREPGASRDQARPSGTPTPPAGKTTRETATAARDAASPGVPPRVGRPNPIATDTGTRAFEPNATFEEIRSRSEAERREKRRARDAQLDKALELKSARFTQDGAAYRMLPGVRTVAHGTELPTGAELIEERRGLVYFWLDPKVAPPPGSMPAVMRESDRELRALTGNLILHSGDAAAMKALADRYGMKLLQTVDDIGVTYFQSGRDTPAQLLGLVASIHDDGKGPRAEIELTSGRPVPK